MQRRRIDFDEVRDCILVFLDNQYFDDSHDFVSFGEIKKKLKNIPANAIRDLLLDMQEAYIRQKIVKKSSVSLITGQTTSSDQLADGYRINRGGIEHVRRMTDARYDAIQTKLDLPILQDQDDSWSPMPVDRSSPEVATAIGLSEKVVDELAKSNGFAATEPEVRNGLLATMQGAIKALKDGFPSRNSIIEGLLKPMKFVAEKFATASIGELAKQAVAAILKAFLS